MFRVQESARKVVASICSDAQEILTVDYIQKGQTLHAKYYVSLLEKLKASIVEEHPKKSMRLASFSSR